MPKIQRIDKKDGTTNYFITLPKSLIEKKKWVKGQDLFLAFNERGNIEIQD